MKDFWDSVADFLGDVVEETVSAVAGDDIGDAAEDFVEDLLGEEDD